MSDLNTQLVEDNINSVKKSVSEQEFQLNTFKPLKFKIIVKILASWIVVSVSCAFLMQYFLSASEQVRSNHTNETDFESQMELDVNETISDDQV